VFKRGAFFSRWQAQQNESSKMKAAKEREREKDLNNKSHELQTFNREKKSL
jgi:hypothetical protein